MRAGLVAVLVSPSAPTHRALCARRSGLQAFSLASQDVRATAGELDLIEQPLVRVFRHARGKLSRLAFDEPITTDQRITIGHRAVGRVNVSLIAHSVMRPGNDVDNRMDS